MKTASLPLVLFSAAAFGAIGAASASRADAGVRVEVDPGAPFTEADLADAVDIRTPAAAVDAGDDVVIRVAKLGMDQLVVIVGDRSQVVTLVDRDRTSSSRVVALVVTALLDGDEVEVAARPSTVPVADTGEPVVSDVAPPAPAPRNLFLAGGAITRDDNGYWVPLLNLGVARAMAPNVRLVGMLGVGQYDRYLGTHSLLFPARVGIEARAGAAGIEIGGQVTNFREGSCGPGDWGHYEGVYGAGKIFLPLGAHTRIVGELGGHFVVASSPTFCTSGPNFTAYGGWLGGGIEWAP